MTPDPQKTAPDTSDLTTFDLHGLHPLWFLGLLAAILLLAGCQPTTPASAIAPNTAQTETPTATVIASPTLAQRINPPIVFTVAPEPTATFALPTVTPIPTVTAVSPADSSETATPEPTFTPPALPHTDPNEHYWLRRPIPEGGTVWTDKVYPYGSTRGGTLQTHHGVEFYVPSGTPVLAVASGTVRVAGSDDTFAQGPATNFYGNVVVIELDSQISGQPVYALYGHLSEIYVSEGQHVDAEQVIALSGATGVAEGPHLHLEVRVGQNSYDATRNPSLWLYPFPDHGAVAGVVRWPDGSPVRQALVTLNRLDAAAKYSGTTTYADESVNGDDGWQENFVIDDVAAGYYVVTVHNGDKKHKAELWVYPFRTSFVEITLDE